MLTVFSPLPSPLPFFSFSTSFPFALKLPHKPSYRGLVECSGVQGRALGANAVLVYLELREQLCDVLFLLTQSENRSKCVFLCGFSVIIF